MKKILAISLLIFYVASFMGYGVFTLAHTIGHQVPNILHHHDTHGHHHHVEDHGDTFEKLKTMEKEANAKNFPLKIIYLFSFLSECYTLIFEKPGICEIIMDPVYNLIIIHQNPPPTPPPLLNPHVIT